MKKFLITLRRSFCFSWRDLGIMLGLMAGAALLSWALQQFSPGDGYVSLLFLFAVFLTSRLTEGYLFGILASVVGVIGVNYIFTYPYLAFNFTISGYPLTFLTMLASSVVISALTSQIKRQEAVWLEAQKQAVRANLLRAVSHDLRTPLTSIAGSLSVVLEHGDALDAQTRTSLLEGARDDAQWLIRMVENLLSVTRLDSEGAVIVKTLEPVEEVVGETVAKLRSSWPQLPLQVTVPDELLMTPMDHILIEQVLTNLLENAAQHAVGATQVRLTVTAESGSAAFTISDNGCGLDPAALPRLFDGLGPAVRGGERRGSTGIGLSVCRTIVRAHGGDLTAANAPGGGAVFRFTLPLEAS